MGRKKSSRLPQEVFLSHSSRNRTFVNKLADVLREHGIPVWYSETNIVGAQQWHDEIGNALDRCDWFVLVISPSAVKSEWVKRELVRALMEPSYQDRIVPIMYRPSDPDQLSWTLKGMQLVDFTGAFDKGCRDLLRVWGVGHAGKS